MATRIITTADTIIATKPTTVFNSVDFLISSSTLKNCAGNNLRRIIPSIRNPSAIRIRNIPVVR
ncbi:MAG: hypothetical protein O8C64_00840 [Candidatus Methanoperedens sp.]|nr:hypothetical protein [Candidatus Methanoperedens sp.]